jgi:hypothetical protein
MVTPSPATTTPSGKLATCNESSSKGSAVARSAFAGFSVNDPTTWTCKAVTDNARGGREEIVLTSAGNFQIQLVSFSTISAAGQDASDSCNEACIATNNSEKVELAGFGQILLDEVSARTNVGTANHLIGRTTGLSMLIPSPKSPNVRTTIWGVFQGRGQDVEAKTSPTEFAASTDVLAAKSILKTITY